MRAAAETRDAEMRLIFLVISLVAGALGFTGTTAGAATIARIRNEWIALLCPEGVAGLSRARTRRSAMKACYAGPLSLAAILVTTPGAASPAVIVVAAALATAIGVSASQQPYEAWQYTAKYGWVGGARDDVSMVEHPLTPRSGTSAVSACRDALMRLAQPYDLASMEVVGDGKPRRVNGRTIAPLDVRAIYRVRGVHEVTRSKVRCEMDRAGRVVATIDTGPASLLARR